jgi:hypothetical protein
LFALMKCKVWVISFLQAYPSLPLWDKAGHVDRLYEIVRDYIPRTFPLEPAHEQLLTQRMHSKYMECAGDIIPENSLLRYI